MTVFEAHFGGDGEEWSQDDKMKRKKSQQRIPRIDSQMDKLEDKCFNLIK